MGISFCVSTSVNTILPSITTSVKVAFPRCQFTPMWQASPTRAHLSKRTDVVRKHHASVELSKVTRAPSKIKMYGATNTTPLAPPARMPMPAQVMVLVYFTEPDGFAQAVKVPVGSDLIDLADVVCKHERIGTFRGFENCDLHSDHRVTEADAALWTKENPLRVKYKREDCCLIL